MIDELPFVSSYANASNLKSIEDKRRDPWDKYTGLQGLMCDRKHKSYEF